MKKGTGIFKQLFHLSSRSRTPKRPPPLLSNDIGHSSNQQPVSVPHVLSSLNSTGLPAPSGERRGNKAAWAALKTSLGLLYESANAFGSLKSVIGGISQCIDIFERAAKSREDYETLATDLDTICQDLCGYLDGFAPPAMMSNIDSLAKGIEREVKFVMEKEQRNGLERVAEAMNDSEEVLQCYSRIQRLLERFVRNASMASWRIVDEQVTTNRLASLPYSPAARYLSAESANLRGEGCTQNTRVDVLKTLGNWAYNSQSKKIYWLNGMAGTGKTTITDSLCAQLKSTNTLAASFFCSRQLPTCNDVNHILPSISYQLALFSPPFRHALSRVLEQTPEAHNQPLSQQFEQLIAEPLRQVKNTISSNLVVVIDALDECVDQSGVDRVLETLLSHASDLPIKFFVTSRPESKIRDRMLKRAGEQNRSVLHLHDLEHSIVREDIKTYLKFKFKSINLPAADLEHLVELSGVLFIYAATLVRYIEADNFSRSADRLRLVLSSSTSSSSNKDKTIDGLYSTILQAAFNDPDLDEHEKDKMEQVLHTVLCAQEPLTVNQMAGLLVLDPENVVRPALRPLLSVLHVSEISELVTTLHQSFPDYIFTQTRSKEFYCSQSQHNALLTERCFRLIGTPNPPFNICDLKSSYLRDDDVPNLDERIGKAISPALLYACQYLGAHLELVKPSERLLNELHEFLSSRLLLWMEILNLNRRIHVGARGLYQVQAWTQRTKCPLELQRLARDAAGFVTMFSSNAVSRSTPHIYISALPFWPEQRPISKHYLPKMRGLPRASGMGMSRREAAPLAIFLTPSDVYSVACSSDSAHIVSGSLDGAIRVWDAHTGKMVGEALTDHTNRVWSVACSPVGAHIVSGSDDETIRVWDAYTGKMIGEPLKGHTGVVYSVAYSPDGAHIASGSSDNTVRIWNVHTGKMVGKPLTGHTGAVWSVAYSFDGSRIVSGSNDRTIQVWDARTGMMIGERLEGHTDIVRSVAYSSDGARIVSGSGDSTVRIWDAHTGMMVGEPLRGHTNWVWSVLYSSDGAHIVSASRDKTIRIWDAYTGEMIGEPLEGHTSLVASVAYSSDGARIVSGSDDNTIRIWDVHTRKKISEPFQGHTCWVWSVACSNDGARIVSGSSDQTLRIWDAHTSRMIGEPLVGHTGVVFSVAYSSDSTHIVSGSGDKTIRVWDAHTGMMIGEALRGHADAVYSVAYASDGAHIISGSHDKTVRIWDAYTGGVVGEVLRGHTGWVLSVAYSSNGTHIVSGSQDKTIRIWDARTGNMIGEPLEGHSDMVMSVAYSPDGAHIVSGSSDKTVRIWDAYTGTTVGEPLRGHTDEVNSVAYSSDGAYIVSGSDDKTIRIWDAHAGKMIGESLKGHTDMVFSVACSPHSACIVSGSRDGTIRLANLEHEPHNAWVLDEDGYMLSSVSKLLMWVPSDVRDTLMRPQNTAIISTQGSVKVDLTNAHIGESWSQCFRPT